MKCARERQLWGACGLPNGGMSSYRTYSQQVYLRNMWCRQGRCGNAAAPGTSNHGWGLAVDGNGLAQRGCDSLTQFRWQRACSDAPWESWHRRFCGGWSGPAPQVQDPLNKTERRLVNELVAIRRRWQRRGGKRGKVEIKRANAIKKWIRAEMKLIRKKAKKYGWDKERRRTRYRLLKRAYYGNR